MWLGRWLDPPEKVEWKRRWRAAGKPKRPYTGLTVTHVGVVVPMGCMVPLLVAALLVALLGVVHP